MTHLHSEIGGSKELRAEVARLGHDVERMNATMTNTANSVMGPSRGQTTYMHNSVLALVVKTRICRNYPR